jgi:4-hydroxy-3-methylbut-2-enyl diphosphate reductase
MQVILAQPRGFCAGVVRAIEIVERALEKYDHPIYVRHEIVHNRHVVESLKAKGARFVENLSEVPPNAMTIFSAHGVSRTVEEEAAARNLPVLDATCPLVTKVHNQGKRYIAPDLDPDRSRRSPGGRRHHGSGVRPGISGAERK